jgi:hypothetical protein
MLSAFATVDPVRSAGSSNNHLNWVAMMHRQTTASDLKLIVQSAEVGRELWSPVRSGGIP